MVGARRRLDRDSLHNPEELIYLLIFSVTLCENCVSKFNYFMDCYVVWLIIFKEHLEIPG